MYSFPVTGLLTYIEFINIYIENINLYIEIIDIYI